MPGDSEELKEFRDHCLSRTRTSIEINLGEVHCRLPNKAFLELLYNRYDLIRLLIF